MPVACARCSTVNPDGNTFCVNCGGPLAAPAAVQPAAPVSPPVPQPAFQQPQAPQLPATPQPIPPQPYAPQAGAGIPPTYYTNPGQTPYYTPPAPGAGGPGAVHRLSRNALIAIIAAAVLVIAGIGAIVALAGKGSKAPVYSPPPVASSQPVAPTQASVPTPQPTVRPTQPPAQPPGGTTSGGGQPLDAGFALLPALPGFTAQSPQNGSIELDATDNSGQIFVSLQSGVSGVSSNQQLADALLQTDQKTSPDATRCGSDQAGPALAGLNGAQIPTTIVLICETYTPQNGQAFKAVDGYFAGLAKDSSGAPSAVLINLFAPEPNFKAFLKEIPQGWVQQVQFKATGP